MYLLVCNLFQKMELQMATTHKKKWQPRLPPIKLGGAVPFFKVFAESKTWIYYSPNFLSDISFNSLLSTIPFETEIKPSGSGHSRKTAWLGETKYEYAGKDNAPFPIPEQVAIIMKKAQERANEILMSQNEEKSVTYKNVLAVLYETGQNSVPYHRDAEDSIIPNSPISSVSYGTSRIFNMRPYKSAVHKAMAILPATMEIQLDDNSILIMGGECQKHWSHGIDKDFSKKDPRMNFTFRAMLDLVNR